MPLLGTAKENMYRKIKKAYNISRVSANALLIGELENNARIIDKVMAPHMDRVNKAGGFGYPTLTINDFALPIRKVIGNIKK
jgi:hypothetical protein